MMKTSLNSLQFYSYSTQSIDTVDTVSNLSIPSSPPTHRKTSAPLQTTIRRNRELLHRECKVGGHTQTHLEHHLYKDRHQLPGQKNKPEQNNNKTYYACLDQNEEKKTKLHREIETL